MASASVPTATGGWSFTVTPNVCVAVPWLLVAVTVTDPSPAASAAKVTVVPDSVAVAVSAAEDITE